MVAKSIGYAVFFIYLIFTVKDNAIKNLMKFPYQINLDDQHGCAVNGTYVSRRFIVLSKQ